MAYSQSSSIALGKTPRAFRGVSQSSNSLIESDSRRISSLMIQRLVAAFEFVVFSEEPTSRNDGCQENRSETGSEGENATAIYANTAPRAILAAIDKFVPLKRFSIRIRRHDDRHESVERWDRGALQVRWWRFPATTVAGCMSGCAARRRVWG